MNKAKIDLTSLNEHYLNKLAFLVHHFLNERQERFYPFYLLFSDETGHPRFREALSVARYFLDNTFLATDEDALFFRAVENRVKKYEATDSDYWDFAGNTPIPMQDYLKVIYDLRK